jgi:hypothetical protein
VGDIVSQLGFFAVLNLGLWLVILALGIFNL